MYYGAIEAGGTKIIGAVGTEKGQIVERVEVPTLTPEETMPELVRFFKQFSLEAMGIGSFGPVELSQASSDYGKILNSPKRQWQGFSFYRYFREVLGCPVAVDTDVNGAALGEYRKGALKGVKNGVYLTVGTGIGAGIIANGELIHGMQHPEVGHMLLQRHPEDVFVCNCGCHTHCLEGLAAGPALERRTGWRGSEIPTEDGVWELESYYLAQALVNLALILSTERIVLGGGVMQQDHLFPKIRERFTEIMAGYIRTGRLEDMDSYIVPAGLQGSQGIIGALYLGMQA